MKSNSPAWDISKPQLKWTLIVCIGLAWVFLVVLLESINQINEHKKSFKNQLDTFISDEVIENNKIETLIDALSEHYGSQPISSMSRLEEFIQGLSKQYDDKYLFGLARYINQNQIQTLESGQAALGYEGFKISNAGLYKEQSQSSKEPYLIITYIAPLTPLSSVYLSNNLFSIPHFKEVYSKTVEFNKVFNELVVSALNNEYKLMSFKPFFTSNIENLSLSQRLKRSRGVVFIETNIEQELQKKAHQLFSLNTENQHIEVELKIQKQPQPIIKNSLNSHFNWATLSLTLHETFILPFIHENHVILLKNDFGNNTLNYNRIVIAALLALISYWLSIFIWQMFARSAKKVKETQTQYSQAMETSQNAIIITDENGLIIEWNPEASRLFGYSKKDAIGQNIIQLIFSLSDKYQHLVTHTANQTAAIKRCFEELLELNNTNKHETLQIQLKTSFDSLIYTEVTTSVLDVNKRVEISLFIKDISFRHQAEARMERLAYYDSLTNLENRVYFELQMAKVIKNNPDEPFCVLFMDLDGFKQVNDTLGHRAGDRLLKVISSRLESTLRSTNPNEHLCRFGGDEFVVMLQKTQAFEVINVAKEILDKVEQVVQLDTDELTISTSIGIAIYPNHGNDVDTILRRADTAMYHSKGLGSNTYSFYNDSMEAQLAERTQIQKFLRGAIESNEFHMVYQPQINIQTGKVIGVEALIRWQNPVLGNVPPDKFITIAEESNLIVCIGDWVIAQCIEQLAYWKDTPFNDLQISLNVSSRQLEALNFLSKIEQQIKARGVDSDLLELELTERAIMSNIAENISVFNEIRAKKYRLAVDDFGTGYSSLSYLKRFPLNVLKIDKSFVDGIPTDEEDSSISTSIINLAKSLNIEVVAEGVETSKQLEFLKQQNCEYAQGYLISRPLKIKELEDWVTNNQFHFKLDNTNN